MIEKLDNGTWVIQEDTHISKWVKEHGSLKCDPHLFAWLRPKLRNVGVIWDVGANIGDHTRFYLDLGKVVVAVEPNPEAFECLQHNCPEAILVHAAAAAVSGAKLKFTLCDNVGASRISQNGNILVNSLALGTEKLPAPDFIKIDVEGYELSALMGMIRVLEWRNPPLFIEINRGALAEQQNTPKDVTDWLRLLGYTQFVIYPPNLDESAEQYDLYVTK